MEDISPAGSGCTGPLILGAIAIVVVACVWLGSSLLTEQITANQAQQAQAQAVIAEQHTEQTRIVEDAHTERWQSFLVAMRGAQSDVSDLAPWALLSLSVWAGVGYLAIRDRKGRKE